MAVQARQTLDENDGLLALADRHPFIRGVVGWVDLAADDVAAPLARYAGHAKFRGVRHPVRERARGGIPVAGRLPPRSPHAGPFRPDLRPPAAAAAPAGRAQSCSASFPTSRWSSTILAKPRIAAGELSPWREDLAALARCENVCCKLSGMVTEAAWGHWRPEDFTPYLDVVLEAFGPRRVMIGSDWPVCTLSGEYAAVMELVAALHRGVIRYGTAANSRRHVCSILLARAVGGVESCYGPSRDGRGDGPLGQKNIVATHTMSDASARQFGQFTRRVLVRYPSSLSCTAGSPRTPRGTPRWGRRPESISPCRRQKPRSLPKAHRNRRSSRYGDGCSLRSAPKSRPPYTPRPTTRHGAPSSRMRNDTLRLPARDS